ncbi:MAG: SCO family protein [Gammaproteobacteria bacterium]|nr:SCO family protein [Gammaproteobacteria bacterium]
MSIMLQQKQHLLSDHTLAFTPARSLPDFQLLDHTGQNVGNEILEGQWSLLFFGFTNCPDVCPNTLSLLKNLQSRIKNPEHNPQIVLVSVDPMRDTPEKMQAYVSSFKTNIIGLTGELHKIQVLTDFLGVAYAYNALPDGSYTVDHTAAVFVLNPDGEYAGIYTGNLAAPNALETLADDYRIITETKYP